MADESHGPAFLALNPNGKIPAIYDPDGPSDTPLALFESGARVHGMFAKFCPVYRSLHPAIAITTELVFDPS
jgi:hypothetical protein